MSMTKRMWEQGKGLDYTDEEKEKQKNEKNKLIASVFLVLNKYHLSFLKNFVGLNKSKVYEALNPNKGAYPSKTTFYKNIKEAGGLNEYLTYYFFKNKRKCLINLGVSSPEIEKLMNEIKECNWVLSLDEANLHTPKNEDINLSTTKKYNKKERGSYIRKSSKILTQNSIYEFYSRIYDENKLFYTENKEQLFNLEIMDHKDYLKSPFWFLIRSTVLYRDNFKCICGDKATCVHHIDYEVDTLYGKNLEKLVSLCESCHEKIEFDNEGNKRFDLDEKYYIYKKMANK